MQLLYIILFLLLTTGCAVTDLTSYQDPKYANKKYSSFLVLTNFSDLSATQFMESRACEEFTKRNIQCKRGIDIFPPTRTYTDQQWIDAFNSSGMEAIVILELVDSYSTQMYIPQSSTTRGSITSSGYGNYYYRGNTTTTGGYNISKPVEKYSITVADGKTGDKVIIIS